MFRLYDSDDDLREVDGEDIFETVSKCKKAIVRGIIDGEQPATYLPWTIAEVDRDHQRETDIEVIDGVYVSFKSRSA